MNRSRVETRIVLTHAQHFTVYKAPVWTLCISRKLTILPRRGYADGGLWALSGLSRAELWAQLPTVPPGTVHPDCGPGRGPEGRSSPRASWVPSCPPISSAGKGGGLSSPLPFVRAGERAGLLVPCFFPSSRRQGSPSVKGYRLACDSVASLLQSSQRCGGRGFPCVRLHPRDPRLRPRDARLRARSWAPPRSVTAGLCRAVQGDDGPVGRRRVCCPHEVVQFARSARGPPAAPSPPPRPVAPSPARLLQG